MTISRRTFLEGASLVCGYAAARPLEAAINHAAHEYHVSPSGNNRNNGSPSRMLATIGAAAARAYPGDIITVHQGTYRERVDPPRGGLSDDRRIVYRAAAGERVDIVGSEVVTNWVKVQGDVWK